MAEGAVIEGVRRGSLSARMHINKGDRLLAVNGRPVSDILDYKLLTSTEQLRLLIEKPAGEIIEYETEKEFDEDPGLLFVSPTIDPVIRCTNACFFCFVEQMPPGFRPSLYLKDDDYRLSFLHGNYITLNNISEQELRRIVRLRLSPLYVSVHVSDPALRSRLMGSPKAALGLTRLQKLADEGIEIHAQVVLCPGINDGYVLQKTIDDCSRLWPSLRSIAIVPVGLTAHRNNLYPVTPVDKDIAREMIRQIEPRQKAFKKTLGSTFVFLADEFYLLAEHPFPRESLYDNYPQLENGVGLVRLFLNEYTEWKKKLPFFIPKPLSFSLVTGKAAASFMKRVANALNKVEGVKVFCHVVENKTFGGKVTVAGLLAGKDLLLALKGRVLGKFIIFPRVMLKKDEPIFLDDLTPNDVARTLGVPLFPALSLQDITRKIFSLGGLSRGF